MNVQDELKALKERIAELEEQAEEEQDFPQEADDYLYISGVCISWAEDYF